MAQVNSMSEFRKAVKTHNAEIHSNDSTCDSDEAVKSENCDALAIGMTCFLMTGSGSLKRYTVRADDINLIFERPHSSKNKLISAPLDSIQCLRRGSGAAGADHASTLSCRLELLTAGKGSRTVTFSKQVEMQEC